MLRFFTPVCNFVRLYGFAVGVALVPAGGVGEIEGAGEAEGSGEILGVSEVFGTSEGFRLGAGASDGSTDGLGVGDTIAGDGEGDTLTTGLLQPAKSTAIISAPNSTDVIFFIANVPSYLMPAYYRFTVTVHMAIEHFIVLPQHEKLNHKK